MGVVRHIYERIVFIITLFDSTLSNLTRMLLCLHEEKRIPYKVIKVAMRCYGDKPQSFMKMNPSGGIPVAIVKVRKGEKRRGRGEKGRIERRGREH